jgi:hypothetical protein
MKLSLRIPLTDVANEYTLCANDLRRITANAAEIPTKTLDKNMNCLLVSLLLAQLTMSSVLRIKLRNILYQK